MKFDFDTWICPFCGWIITDIELQQCRYDYGCPRCKIKFAKFIPNPQESHNKTPQV